MRYAFIKCEDLSSAAFRGAEPVDRATWLCLLAWCYEHENGGRITGAKSWGDRRWQQTVAVMLKEVQRDASGLWSWDGDDLVVGFYDHTYAEQVRADSRQGTAGGRATSQAKAEASRRNGALGGQRKEPNGNPTPNPTPNPTGTQQPAQHDNPPEPNEPKPVCLSVCQAVSQSNTAAAAPPSREPPPPAADPMDQAFQAVEQANPPPRRPIPPASFADWRIMVGKRCFVGNDERAEWLAMFQAEGWDEMTEAYQRLTKKHPEPAKIFLSMFQEIRE